MMRGTCSACQYGQHDSCVGRQPPPKGMLGGFECDCDGDCARRAAEPDSEAQRFVDSMLDAMRSAGNPA